MSFQVTPKIQTFSEGIKNGDVKEIKNSGEDDKIKKGKISEPTTCIFPKPATDSDNTKKYPEKQLKEIKLPFGDGTIYCGGGSKDPVSCGDGKTFGIGILKANEPDAKTIDGLKKSAKGNDDKIDNKGNIKKDPLLCSGTEPNNKDNDKIINGLKKLAKGNDDKIDKNGNIKKDPLLCNGTGEPKINNDPFLRNPFKPGLDNPTDVVIKKLHKQSSKNSPNIDPDTIREKAKEKVIINKLIKGNPKIDIREIGPKPPTKNPLEPIECGDGKTFGIGIK
ncbi:MAG: hypothetical protein U0457_08315 [Candidatus Sericytochromatia bacterium]